MAPGSYLEKRRLMAGYSLPGLARELLALQGFGTSRSLDDLHRLHLCLISAEQGTLHHSRARIQTIRAFVPLDVSLYLHLVDCDRSGDPYRVAGLCRVCACSFHDPCVLHVGPTAALGSRVCDTGEDVCSACEQRLGWITPDAFQTVGRDGPSIAEQLRDIGDRIRAIATREDARAAKPPFLRVVPNTGEN